MTPFKTLILIAAISLIVTNAYLVYSSGAAPEPQLSICRPLTAEEAKGLDAEFKWEECKSIFIIK